MALLSAGWDLRQVVETCGYHVVGALVHVDQGFEHMKKSSLLTTASRLQGAMRLLQGASAGGNAADGSG
jgi:hypothetical protein